GRSPFSNLYLLKMSWIYVVGGVLAAPW
ncbi:MAG: hypothetical protein RIQ95_1361, partial [Pseudomonadota bacterium]